MRRIFQFLVIFIVVLYCSFAYGYLYENVFPSLKVLYWYIFTIGFALSIAILRLPSLLPKEYLYFVVWIFVYLCYSIFNYLYSSQNSNAEQYLTTSIEMSVLLLSFLIIFQIDDSIRLVRLTIVLVVMFSVVMNLIDFITPMWSKVPGRAAGLYESPTNSGKMLVFMMVAGLPLIAQKFRLIYCMFIGIGVLITFSRGPWLLWGVAMLGLASTGYFVFARKLAGIFFVGVLCFAILFLLLTGGMLEYLRAFGLVDYLTPNTLARLGASGQAFVDISTESRVDVAKKAWAVFQNNPWLGAGMGYTRGGWGIGIGPHNMYLTLAAEGGLLGVAVFLSLLAILFYTGDGIGKVITIVYAASSMTSHNNLEQPALLIILAFIVVTNKVESARLQIQTS